MKKILFILLILSSNVLFAWETNFDNAKKIALATNKLIVIDFWATWCKPCVVMEKETWQNEKVKNLLNNYIALKLDLTHNRELALKYNINSIPTILICDSNGNILHVENGYKDASTMSKILEKYSFDTSLIKNILIENYKLDNYNSNNSLGLKYMYLSLFNSPIKYDLINLGDAYFNIARKKLTKSELKNSVYIQKNKLFDLIPLLFKFKFDKVKNAIDKNFSEDTILDENKEIFYFLKYTCASNLNQTDSDLYKEKLKNINPNSEFIKIGEKIIDSSI